MPGRFIRQSFSLPPPMLKTLREEAARQGISLSEALRQYLRHGGLGQRKGLDLEREGGNSDDSG